jgi:pSer/pThr/pTyr-binding forkhead associated (FHA) protein
MQQCSNCGHQNRAGVVFCENCGASLIGKVPLDTKSLEGSSAAEKAQIGVDASVLTDVKIQGISIFHEGDMLQLEVEGSPEPVVFKPSPETIFGRRDPATGAMPDVDLTPFAGYRMGVSRRHAAIRLGDNETLDIWDLGSSNGTYLNGQRLGAHRPYRLHDGDELRLGQMMIRVFFQSAEKLAKAPEAAEAVKTPEPQAEAKQAAAAEAKTGASITGAPKPAETKAEPAAPTAPEPSPVRPEVKEAPVASKPEAAAEQEAEEAPARPKTQPLPPKEEVKETPPAPAPELSAAQPEAKEAPTTPRTRPAAPKEELKETQAAPAPETAASKEKSAETPAAPEQPETPKAEGKPAASAEAPSQPSEASSETSGENLRPPRRRAIRKARPSLKARPNNGMARLATQPRHLSQNACSQQNKELLFSSDSRLTSQNFHHVVSCTGGRVQDHPHLSIFGDQHGQRRPTGGIHDHGPLFAFHQQALQLALG